MNASVRVVKIFFFLSTALVTSLSAQANPCKEAVQPASQLLRETAAGLVQVSINSLREEFAGSFIEPGTVQNISSHSIFRIKVQNDTGRWESVKFRNVKILGEIGEETGNPRIIFMTGSNSRRILSVPENHVLYYRRRIAPGRDISRLFRNQRQDQDLVNRPIAIHSVVNDFTVVGQIINFERVFERVGGVRRAIIVADGVDENTLHRIENLAGTYYRFSDPIPDIEALQTEYNRRARQSRP